MEVQQQQHEDVTKPVAIDSLNESSHTSGEVTSNSNVMTKIHPLKPVAIESSEEESSHTTDEVAFDSDVMTKIHPSKPVAMESLEESSHTTDEVTFNINVMTKIHLSKPVAIESLEESLHTADAITSNSNVITKIHLSKPVAIESSEESSHTTDEVAFDSNVMTKIHPSKPVAMESSEESSHTTDEVTFNINVMTKIHPSKPVAIESLEESLHTADAITSNSNDMTKIHPLKPVAIESSEESSHTADETTCNSNDMTKFHPLKPIIESLEESLHTADESDVSDLSNRPVLKDDYKPLEIKSRSILKLNSDSHTQYVLFDKKSWKQLPVPEMEKMKKAEASRQSASLSPRKTKRSKSLAFDQIHVRYFDQTLGDHPSTSYGPPISLDWNYEDGESVFLEDYEKNRKRRRTLRELMLNYYTRRNTLMWQYGYSEAELKRATRLCEWSAFQRSVTRYFLPISKVEEMVQSAGRKARRVVKKSDKTGNSESRKLTECSNTDDKEIILSAGRKGRRVVKKCDETE